MLFGKSSQFSFTCLTSFTRKKEIHFRQSVKKISRICVQTLHASVVFLPSLCCRVAVLDKVTDFLLFLGKLLISGSVGGFLVAIIICNMNAEKSRVRLYELCSRFSCILIRYRCGSHRMCSGTCPVVFPVPAQ